MKTQILIPLVLISLIAVGYSHGSHGHFHDDDHDHSHDHNHGHPHTHSNQQKQKDYASIIFNQVKTFYQEQLITKAQQVSFSVFLVSFPSVPTFLFLVFLQRFYNKNYEFSQSLLNKMISFSVGTLLGDVLLHIMPPLFEESLKNGAVHDHPHHHHGDDDHGNDHGEHHGHSHGDLKTPFLIIFGIMFFLVLDFVFIKLNGGHDHGHNHSHGDSNGKQNNNNKIKETKKGDQSETVCEKKRDNQAFTFLIGDFLHNVTDGLALGAAFSNSLSMGLTTTFVVVIHELPHEMGDFAFLIKKNFGLLDILKTQVITSLGALVGGLIGIQAGEIFKFELLSLTAGGFLYMCLSQILPEIRGTLGESKKVSDLFWTIFFMCLGISSMYYITLIE